MRDEWAAWQLDQAVLYLGVTLESLLEETENTGTSEKPHYERKYTLKQLLDEDYRVRQAGEPMTDIRALKKVQGIIVEGL